MTRTTATLLVLLRLAIGWHFAVEGWHKVHSALVGTTETNRPFSSEGYFREAPGPFARAMRAQLGDPDDELLARLTVQPLPADQDPAKYPAQNRIPPALAKDWDDYFARFAAHYALNDQQKKLAEAKLEQAKHNVVVWLTQKEAQVKKSFPTGDVERKEANAQRIADYRAQVNAVRESYDRKLPAFGHDVEKGRLAKAKADLAKARAELTADLKEQTADMQKILNDVLDLYQVEQLPAVVAGALGSLNAPAGEGPLIAATTLIPGRTGILKTEPPASKSLDVLNWVTRWGLLAIGLGLLFGLFTRFWCVLGAGFLLLTYLAAPPMPWWPTPPSQEGTYLFINKNTIEMLALLVLASTRSGRWFGLDALIYGLFTGFREERPLTELRGD